MWGTDLDLLVVLVFQEASYFGVAAVQARESDVEGYDSYMLGSCNDWHHTCAFMCGHEDIMVHRATHSGETILVYGDPTPLEQWLAPMQGRAISSAKETAAVDRGARLPRDIVQRICEQIPWMTEEDVRNYLERQPAQGAVDGAPGGRDAEDCGEPIVDEAFIARAAHAVRADLAAKRDVWEADHPNQVLFYVKVLGGVDTERRFGVVADFIACLARSDTREFRQVFDVQGKYSFSIARYGGEENAHTLSLAMTQRLDFVYNSVALGGLPRDGVHGRGSLRTRTFG